MLNRLGRWLGSLLRSIVDRIGSRRREPEGGPADHAVAAGDHQPVEVNDETRGRLAELIGRTREELSEVTVRLQRLEPPSIRPRLGELTDDVRGLLRSRMWLRVLIGGAVGVGLGLVLSPEGVGVLDPSEVEEVGGYMALPGDIFLALLEMIVVPLVVSSIVLGVSSAGDPAVLRRVGSRTLAYFVSTTAIAISIGFAVALLIRPGDRLDPNVAARMQVLAGDAAAVGDQGEPDGVADRIVSLVPSDPLGAALDQNLLQLVVFAILVGVAILAIERRHADPVLAIVDSVQEISLKVVSWAMRLAPYAVAGLLGKLTLEIGFDALAGTASYVATVLAGLALMVVVYTGLARVIGGISPGRFLRAARDPQLLAFSTSSSASVMPMTMQAAQDGLGVRPSTTRFVVPLGATVNMDGTALYQVVATLFLVQFYDIDVATPGLIVLALTVVGASIGTPSTPGVGIVILGTILADVGVPAGGIALVIGVDRILDMSRTVVNVTGDLTACLVLERWVGDALPDDTRTASVAPDEPPTGSGVPTSSRSAAP